MNRTLLDKARSMIHGCKMSKDFWSEAVRNAYFLTNRLPHSGLDGKSPFQVAFGSLPKLDPVRTFGRRAFVLALPKTSKLDSRTHVSVFMGLDLDTGCYRSWCSELGRMLRSKDVIFDESVFPKVDFDIGTLSFRDLKGSQMVGSMLVRDPAGLLEELRRQEEDGSLHHPYSACWNRRSQVSHWRSRLETRHPRSPMNLTHQWTQRRMAPNLCG